jgi:Domain of unknown function (DUF4129)
MDKFQKTNWSWQLEQLQERLAEWIEAKLRFAAPKQGLPAWLIHTISFILWAMLGIGVMFTFYLLLKRYIPNLATRRTKNDSAPPPDRIYTITELLAQAQQFQSKKNYSEACRYLYLAALQRLNDANLIPHQNSRTDREYAAILCNLPTITQSNILLQTHEQLQFADRTITVDGFNRCQEAYTQLDIQLKNQAGQTA